MEERLNFRQAVEYLFDYMEKNLLPQDEQMEILERFCRDSLDGTLGEFISLPAHVRKADQN